MARESLFYKIKYMIRKTPALRMCIYGAFAMQMIFAAISYYYNYSKDLYNEFSFGAASIMCLCLMCYLSILQSIKNIKVNLMYAITEGNKYERHVIKRLHDELIKKDQETNVKTISDEK